MSSRWKIVFALTAALIGGSAYAQDAGYPSKPVHILVPFSPGSLVDLIARMYGEQLSARMGQPVLIENKAGSGGIVASQALLAANPDGYTFEMVSSSHAINPTLYPKLPYDTAKDMSCVALVASSPTVIVVRNDLGTKSIADFLALARQKPGAMNYGSGGVGTAAHLAGEYFLSQTKTRLVHIPYKGVQEAVTEMMGGRIELAFPPIGVALPQVRASKITALAVTGSERSPLMPDVPTAQEAGLPGFEYGIWYALIASSKTPRPIQERFATEMRAVAALPEIRQKLVQQGLLQKEVSLDECDRFVNDQIKVLGALVTASGAKPE